MLQFQGWIGVYIGEEIQDHFIRDKFSLWSSSSGMQYYKEKYMYVGNFFSITYINIKVHSWKMCVYVK